jgi:myo-inositol-1(or 4)-monophosphatase
MSTNLQTNYQNIVHVAAGQSQAFFEEGPLHIWDMAAAMVILQEAGGVMLDLYGKEVDLLSRRCLAACNQTMAESLVSLFK